jgi:hypothetical protein
MRGAWVLLVATVLFQLPAEAVPRRAAGVVRATPRRALRRAAPRPLRDLQIAGLDTAGERRFHAVLHAIRRDALPPLTACVAQHPTARGVVSVTLTPTSRGHQTPTVSAALAGPFTQCVRAAVASVSLPPREIIDDAPSAAPRADEPVRFELRVRLPAVGAR